MLAQQVIKHNKAEVDTDRLLTGARIDPDNFWKGELEIFRVQRFDVQNEIIRIYSRNEIALQRKVLPVEQPILLQQAIKEVLAVIPSDTGVSLRPRSKRTVSESKSEPLSMSKRLRKRKSQPQIGTPEEEKVSLQLTASQNSNRDVLQNDLKGRPPPVHTASKSSTVSSSQPGESQLPSKDSLSILGTASSPPTATRTITPSEPEDCHSPQQDNMPKISMSPSPSEGHGGAFEQSSVPSPTAGNQNAVGSVMPVGPQAGQRFGGVPNTERPSSLMQDLIDLHSGSSQHEHTGYFPTSYERTRIGLPISQGGNLADETSPMDRGCVDKEGNLIQPLPHPDPLSGFVAAESSVPPTVDMRRMTVSHEGTTETTTDTKDDTKITGWLTHSYSTENVTLKVEIVDRKGNIDRQTLPLREIMDRLSPKDAKGLRSDIIKSLMAKTNRVRLTPRVPTRMAGARPRS